MCKPMKRFLFTYFVILFSLTLFCQETKLVIIKKAKKSKYISECYHVLKSDKQTKHGEYIKYSGLTKDKYKQIKKGKLDPGEYIKIKGNYINGKKSGEWVEYSQPFSLMTKGYYENDNKIGVWITAREKGQVLERFDYSNNKKLPPIIQINTSYPKSAVELELQGTVTVSFMQHKDCSISDVLVTKSLSADCDKIAINAIKRLGEFSIKYGVDCQEKQETYSIEFKLD